MPFGCVAMRPEEFRYVASDKVWDQMFSENGSSFNELETEFRLKMDESNLRCTQVPQF